MIELNAITTIASKLMCWIGCMWVFVIIQYLICLKVTSLSKLYQLVQERRINGI